MSNENQYIEAAKIAAETASKNTHYTMIIALVSALIALFGVGLTAWITYKNASRGAIVDALTKQRIEWLNTLRGKFVVHNALTNEIYLDIYLRKTKAMVSDEFFEKCLILDKNQTHIRLLLNPNESLVCSLNDKFTDLFGVLFNEDIKIESLKRLLYSIELDQQTILKAEWKRIKEEIKKGRELKPKEVSFIYEQTSIENEEFRGNNDNS
ncbi:hypothetical protein [Bacillus altitudinis]|uniref:hypothetical protein n=1 Tax=Bacillus altitudinis TaxID=293387 RepID=UPI000BC34685|nr:hypothetical protein [Bacillus altitudinis]ATH73147.1 hypothetical protein CFN77_13250 [Bacillus altitudinis]